MATFDIKIQNATIKVDAETLEEALEESKDILSQFLSSWQIVES